MVVGLTVAVARSGGPSTPAFSMPVRVTSAMPCLRRGRRGLQAAEIEQEQGRQLAVGAGSREQGAQRWRR